ncbi:hypothetical protein HY989_06285 [Candidatus Micrarchaeota archaeon]|nr:hypothetical protein [Candidatus Micrarchaeota archaeon]
MEFKIKDVDLLEVFSFRWEKIAILATLLLLSTVLSENERKGPVGVNDEYSVKILGFPMGVFGLYEESGILPGNELNNLNKWFLIGIVANSIFWYAVSCGMYFAYNQYTGKGKLGEVQ